MKSIILFIGEEAGFFARICGFLRENGFYVESAANGPDGVRRALSLRPDLILLDPDLPDAQSYDASFWLAYMKGTRRIPVLPLAPATGGPAGAVPRTLSPEKLLRRISGALGVRQ